jgi:hypothetical protein
MQLILAIDSDPRRSEQLANLVRARLEVDLVQATSAGEGLHALGDRIPDLILTAPLLSPFDDGVLDEYLRDLGTAATHVQTLRIPMLSSAPKKKTARSLFSLGRKKQTSSAAPDGCDPKVFADEIAHYLAATQDRSEAAPISVPGRVFDLQTIARPAKPEPVQVVQEFNEAPEPVYAEPPSEPVYVSADTQEPRNVRDAWEPRYVREVAEPLREIAEPRRVSEVPDARFVYESSELAYGHAAPEPVYAQPEPEPVYLQPEPVYVQPEPEPVYVRPEPEPVYVRPEPEPVYVRPEPTPDPARGGAHASAAHAQTTSYVEDVPAPVVELKPETRAVATNEPAKTTGSITSFEAALAAIRAAWVKPEDQKPVDGPQPRAASGEVDLTSEIDSLEDSDGVANDPATGDSSADDSKAPSSRRKVEKPRKRPPEKPRARKARGAADEWGVFDPNQCGFSALVNKLDEVTDANEVTPRPAHPRAASVGSRA